MPHYRLRVRGHFEAAHHLTAYHGAPEPSHGHSWQVEAVLEHDELDREGMAYDFVVLKTALDAILEKFHHGDLNTISPFNQQSPTTERVAAWIFRELHRALPDAPLVELTVWEGPTCAATYRP
jgi:6-pyruvoyltetrahydropterin/6-carboxytetrahydropterin synthase